jgi:hypothetical protein
MAVKTVLAQDFAARPVQALAVGPSQTLGLTTATAAFAARISAGVEVVRLVSDADCYIAFGAFGTVSAAGSFTRLPAGVPEYFRVADFAPDGATPVNVGAGIGVAARTVAGTGNLSMTEMY